MDNFADKKCASGSLTERQTNEAWKVSLLGQNFTWPGNGAVLIRSTWARYMFALAIFALASTARFGLLPVDGGYGFIAFYPAIAIVAIIGGAGPAFLVTVLGGIVANYSFMSPFAQFKFPVTLHQSLLEVPFFLTGILGSFVAYRLRSDAIKQRRSEAAAQISAARQRSLVDNAPYIAWLKDVDGRYLLINKVYADRLRLESPLQAVGKTDFELQASHLAEKYRADDVEVMESRQQKRVVEHAIYDNQLCWMETIKAPIIDAAGRVLGIIGYAVDITERRQAEEALLRSEANLRSALDNSPYLTWLKDQEGRYFAVNKAWLNFFKFENDTQVIGKTDLDIQPKHLAEKYRADDAEVMRSRRQIHLEEKAFSDNRTIWVETYKFPIVDAQGALLGTAGFAIEVTERKQAEAELRIAAAAFEAQDAIMITNADGVILRVNRAFIETTGYSAAEALGETPRLLKSGHHDAGFYAQMWSTIRQAGFWRGEVWDRRKNGEIYPKWLSINAVKDNDGNVTNYVATHTDITDRKAAEEKITALAFYDPLTRLPNRRLLLDRLHRALVSGKRNGMNGALFFIDLDNFKTLNDTFGHHNGDLLLQEVAERLVGCIRECDTVARLGGDEFVVLLEDIDENSSDAATQVEVLGRRILENIGKPYAVVGYGREYHSTASIGVTLFGDKDEDTNELLKQADIAMYQAKSAGKATLRFFDPKLQAAVNAHMAMVEDLREGIKNEQFILYYQPQVEGSRITGAEALIRWRHPERGLVPPAAFIPVAEETGLIVPLGGWVLEAGCRQIAAWAGHEESAGLVLAVNVSARQFYQPDFAEHVLAILDRTGADPRKLKLELTESILVNNIEDIIIKMNILKQHGISFSLDDFGTGYSSLTYLKRLPLGQLKIDRTFIMDILDNASDATIARTIIALGEALGLGVIAEGVETEAQRKFLAEHGCDTYQGYLCSQPLPANEFKNFLLDQDAR